MRNLLLAVTMLNLISFESRAEAKELTISKSRECQNVAESLGALVHEEAVRVREIGFDGDIEKAKESAKDRAESLEEISAILDSCIK